MSRPIYTISSNESEISREQNYRGAGAGAATMSSDTSETGPGAVPELTSSIIARRGLVLCFSHSSGKNTPATHQSHLRYCYKN